MRLVVNKEIQKDKWDSILSKNNFSSPFQSPQFYEFFNTVKNFSADVFAIEEDNKYKALVLVTVQKEKGIKGYFSRRGIVYGGPMIIENGQDHLEKLLKEIKLFYKNKLIYLETRNYFDYTPFKNTFKDAGFNYLPWLNFHLDTSQEINVVKKTMSSSRLRQVKKAIKNGAEWKEAANAEEVLAFYSILSDLYKNKIKKPLFSKEFFIAFYKQKMGKYLLVYFEGKVIGGIMCPIMPKKAIYEFYVCGLDSEYKNQYPSIMATWAAMEYANQNDIPLFDFMGAGNPNEAYGVREFKSRFGGEEEEHGRFINILNPFLYEIGVFGLKVLSKLK
ncbi:MAG: peptidoglycan bridge formation glycyltransferase FemA/FemB family protein [Flavobacteriaceae bacterium]